MKPKKTLLRIISKAGTKVLYTALLLYYAFRRSDLPAWARSVVIGALGYLLSPIDSIPDLTPLIGYTDDLGVLSYGLVLIAAYINEDVRKQARLKLNRWMGYHLDIESVQKVEHIL